MNISLLQPLKNYIKTGIFSRNYTFLRKNLVDKILTSFINQKILMFLISNGAKSASVVRHASISTYNKNGGDKGKKKPK